MPKKGYKPTEEHKRKVALARKKYGSPMKGKHHSDETKAKMSLHMKGRKPWNYIDGRSKDTCRYGTTWTTIKRNILKRDNFTCQNCSAKNIKLTIHHKIPFLETFDNSEENLITLCKGCHLEAEKLNKTKTQGR
jgi:S-adenosylmethionine hydrolase